MSPSSPSRSPSWPKAVTMTPGINGETVLSSIAPSSAAVSSSTVRASRSRTRARTTLDSATRPRLLDSRSTIRERSAASASSSTGAPSARAGPIASSSACCSSAAAAASSRASAANSSTILMFSRSAASPSPTIVRSRRSALMLSSVWCQRCVSWPNWRSESSVCAPQGSGLPSRTRSTHQRSARTISVLRDHESRTSMPDRGSSPSFSLALGQRAIIGCRTLHGSDCDANGLPGLPATPRHGRLSSDRRDSSMRRPWPRPVLCNTRSPWSPGPDAASAGHSPSGSQHWGARSACTACASTGRRNTARARASPRPPARSAPTTACAPAGRWPT